jgi:hypothetical protein
MSLTQKQKNKLSKWYRLKEKLIDIKEQESALRDEIQFELCPHPKKGLNQIDIDDNYYVEIGQAYTYSFEEDRLDSVLKKLMPVHRKKVVRIKRNLDKKYFDKMDRASKKILEQVIIEKPSKPTLTIKEKKNEQ